MGFFYVSILIIELTGRLTVFFGNFAIKPFADVVCSYLCQDCKNKIKKVFHYISSSPCQIRPG
uniref:Uncharacterized protein n=1 Tax=Enterococcus faecium TaxID=1352 RepID=A0A0D5MBA0_ENTFC|nr:hypothetical protein pEfm12493_061 [Enterococcus faecium]